MQEKILSMLLPRLGVIFLPLDAEGGGDADTPPDACVDEAARNFLSAITHILQRLSE